MAGQNHLPSGQNRVQRLMRAGLVLLAGWLVLEAALLHLVAERIGWGATIALHSLKGGVGLLVLGWLTFRGLVRFRKRDGEGIASFGPRLGFGIASAVLIALPGLAPAVLGIALFSPSLRAWLIKRFSPLSPAMSREIALDDTEWRELRRQRSRKPKSGKSKPAPPSLEARPPSV